jgi:tetratricopeptide (TPR) repeat protein
LGATLSFAFFFYSIGEANSFPFRSINIGDKLPAVSVKGLNSQQTVNLSQFQGKPMMVVFFGADISTKKKRSIKALKVVQKLLPFAGKKGINTLVVNVEGDSPDVINEVVSSAALSAEVYVDDQRQAYSGFGIFVMPSILLVTADGLVAAGMGYSRDLPKRLKGEIEIMLGEKTRAQVAEELRPKMVQKSAKEKGAKRHYNLGMTMIERGQPEVAMRELKKAIAIEPGMGQAHTILGCLQLDDDNVADAKVSLAKGIELEPELVAGQICLARIKALEGDLDGAIDDINFMMLRNSRSDELHYVLGKMLEEKADISGAVKEYRKAYELLEKKSHSK